MTSLAGLVDIRPQVPRRSVERNPPLLDKSNVLDIALAANDLLSRSEAQRQAQR